MAAGLSSPILVGRDDDLGRLVGAVREAAAGSPRLLVVGGEAGIGKTRLVSELAARGAAGGARVLVGGCLDLADGGPPYLPFVEAFRRLVRETPPDRRQSLLGSPGLELARLIPDLTAAPDAEPPPGIEQNRLFELVLSLVGRLARDRTLVIVVEDAHWIDRASRDLVTFLARNLTVEPVLVVLTWRTDFLPPEDATATWLAELLRHPRAERLDLRRLERDEVGRLVEAIRGDRPGDEALERTWARSDGNPFFVEELTASGATESAAPPTIVEIVEGRMAGLSAPARDVLSALAVAAAPVDDELLGEVVGLPADEILPAIREAIDRHIVEVEPGSESLRFRHVLLREVVERRLLRSERRDLHERFARAIARRGAPERMTAGTVAALARHWDGADRPDEAFAAAVEAGRAASAVAAHGQAQRLYERALEIAERREAQPAPAERIALLRAASDAAELAGDYDRATELILVAIGVVDATMQPGLAGLLRGRHGYLLWLRGDAEAALTEHEAAVELVRDEAASAERARVLAAFGGALLGLGRFVESRAACEEAIRSAVAAGATADEARARNVLGSDLVALGEIDAGLAELERSRQLARDVGQPELLIAIGHNLALNLAQADRPEDALAEARAGRDAARRAGLERRLGIDLAALEADIDLRLGRWDDARTVAATGLAADPAGRGTIYLSTVLGRLAVLRGEADEAARRFAIADELAAGEIDADLAAYLARGRAEMALAAGKPAAARAAVAAGLAHVADPSETFGRPPLLALGLRALADLAEDARSRRDAAEVRRLAGDADEVASGIAATESAARTESVRAWLALAAAEERRLHGDLDAGRWAALAERLAAVPDPWLTAYARIRQAEAELRARGVRSDAARPLTEAHSISARLGAEPLRREAEALARRARIDLAASDAAAPDGGSGRPPRTEPSPARPARGPAAALPGPRLSPRELEVLRLVADGRTNGEIAERLFITRKTAGVHVTHILDKLGVGNRVEAAMVAARSGLLDGDDAG